MRPAQISVLHNSDTFKCLCSIACADPIGVRHALAIVSELATRDPYAVAMAVGNFYVALIHKSII